VSSITQAASVLLARGSSELFVVRRSENLRFLGGFVAFPGGKVSPADRHVQPLGHDNAPERCVTAARELFEETGVLLARKLDGSFLPAGDVLRYLRRKMVAEELTFHQILDRLGLAIHASDFVTLGSVTTPPFVPTRFDTAFLLARLPPHQEAEVWPGELDWGEWTTPERLLQRWKGGECLVSPPTVVILESINRHALEEIPLAVAAVFGPLHEEAIPPIYFAPNVQLIPLYTQALPPSTHTNAYLVGSGPMYLLDPGTALPAEQERLFALLDAHQARGTRLHAVVLTHQHPDHIGAAMACAQRYGVPIYAHSLTAAKLQGKVVVDRAIGEGEHLDLGEAPDGSGRWHLQAIHTPGHAAGHLAFWEPHYRLLFVGDMVSTLSSVVIAPPEGDLTVYLDSLQRLRGYDCRLLLPAHGSPSARPGLVIDECIAHRVRREHELLAALSATPRSVADLALELYRGLAPAMMRFAELQVLAGLTKLEREGKASAASKDGATTWTLTPDAAR
jgi:endoribonuclease LACTB2